VFSGGGADPVPPSRGHVGTSDLTIRYSNFTTGVDAQIPQGTPAPTSSSNCDIWQAT
jgi:hypothetical protein